MGNKVKEVSAEDIAKAQLGEALGAAKREEQGEILTVLDQLRRSRKSRGGVGKLQVPIHLRDAAAGIGIVVTDRDLDDKVVVTLEETQDNDSDTAQRINESEREEQ